MGRKPEVSGLRLSTVVILCVLFFAAAPAQEQESASAPAQALADLAAGILTCSAHPCLGDGERDVRRLLKGRVVSDGVSDYSDLDVAYPTVGDLFHGLVEWDLDDKLDSVSLKVTDFDVASPVLIAQIQQALPGCGMEREPGEAEAGDVDGDDGADQTQEWSCLAHREDSDDALVELYIAPGLLLFEIDP